MKRLKEKYAEKTTQVIYELWNYVHHAHEHLNNRSTSVGKGLTPDDFTRDKILELIRGIDKFTDKLYLIRKSWTDDLEALAEILTSEEGEQYLEQVDLPESLIKTVLGE